MTAPTVVLVHGAFADASSFARVIPELFADGIPVVAPAVPNRSLVGDAAHIASVVRQIDGPVVLVRHSYGGTVITVAGVEDNVKAPVYGRLRAGRGGEPGGAAGPVPRLRPGFSDLASALVTTSFPVEGGEPGTDVSVDVAKFPAIFAADVEQDLAEVLAVSQRPLAAAAFAEPASAAAWKTRPSWGSVSSADHTINPDLERFGDQRAGATTVEIDSSHLVMLSHPKEVADLVREALCSVTA